MYDEIGLQVFSKNILKYALQYLLETNSQLTNNNSQLANNNSQLTNDNSQSANSL